MEDESIGICLELQDILAKKQKLLGYVYKGIEEWPPIFSKHTHDHQSMKLHHLTNDLIDCPNDQINILTKKHQ